MLGLKVVVKTRVLAIYIIIRKRNKKEVRMNLKKVFKKSTKIAAVVYIVAATTAFVTVVTEKATTSAAALVVKILRDA